MSSSTARRIRHSLALVACASALTAVAPAQAQSTWNLFNGSYQGSGCTQNGTYSGSFNNSWSCTGVSSAGTQQATVSSWSSDRGNTSPGQSYTSYALSGSGYASAYMSSQGDSGFGSTSRTEAQTARQNGDISPLDPGSPNHAFDSRTPGTIDMMLLDFGSTSVILDKIGIGWNGSYDADITVMRWVAGTGDATPAPDRTTGSSSMSGDGHENLSSAIYNPATPGNGGWQLVGSYADLAPDSTKPFGGTARSLGTELTSSWWLISTFNTTLNNGSSSCKKADGTSTTCTAGDESFKLNYIATRPAPPEKVPEPGTVALASLALAGLWGSRRRSRTRRG